MDTQVIIVLKKLFPFVHIYPRPSWSIFYSNNWAQQLGKFDFQNIINYITLNYSKVILINSFREKLHISSYVRERHTKIGL